MSTTTTTTTKIENNSTLFHILISVVKDNILIFLKMCQCVSWINLEVNHQHGISSKRSPSKLNKTTTIIMFHKLNGGLLQKEFKVHESSHLSFPASPL